MAWLMVANGARRVVVTGLGAVTPLGNDAQTTWSKLLAGQSGAAPITQFDPSGFMVGFACEAKDFEPTEWIERKQVRRIDRFAQLIVAAARQAEVDAGLEIAKERELGGASVSIELGTRGPLGSPCTACAASLMAIGEGLDAIRLGRAEVMLCGGGDAAITRTGIAGFAALRALSRRNADPASASRPFDRDRDGFVMGEAGAILVLEELEHAKGRGAKIYAELLGYGVSSDAEHITEPDPTGEHPARAMRLAFRDAGINPDEIDYINAHGTSTPLGDASETRVIKLALGEEKASRTPVSSTKGGTGHCLGAAGALEAIFCTLAIHTGVLPPTINYDTPDPQCDLDYIPNTPRKAKINTAVSNSFGFGGHNASIVLSRFDG
jgi:3-oxoacyl-[acyl-carrier-protein] synthase II